MQDMELNKSIFNTMGTFLLEKLKRINCLMYRNLANDILMHIKAIIIKSHTNRQNLMMINFSNIIFNTFLNAYVHFIIYIVNNIIHVCVCIKRDFKVYKKKILSKITNK